MPFKRFLAWSKTGLPERLASALDAEGYATEAVAEAEAFRAGARSGRYVLGLLHRPSPSGEDQTSDALRDVRRHSALPCVVVAATPLPLCERVAALDAGVDEVLDAAMPLSEAVARVRAVLRRARPPVAAAVASGGDAAPARSAGWRLLPGIRQMQTPDGDSHRLTAAEFDLLRLLVAASGEAVDRDAISRQALRRPWQPDDRAVDGLVKRLRRKLGPDTIQASRGVGYALTVEVHSVSSYVENCDTPLGGIAAVR